MINIKSKITLSLLVLILTGLGVFGITRVSAQDSSNYPSIIQKLAQKFGLKEEDVQAVFNQDKEERHTQMQARFEEQLAQAVTDGKITETQKQLILEKHKELEANRQPWIGMKDKTHEERRAARDAERQELESWAKQNGIDLDYLGGFGHRMGMRGEWMK